MRLGGESLRRIGESRKEPRVARQMLGGDLCLGACEGRIEGGRGRGREREREVKLPTQS